MRHATKLAIEIYNKIIRFSDKNNSYLSALNDELAVGMLNTLPSVTWLLDSITVELGSGQSVVYDDAYSSS